MPAPRFPVISARDRRGRGPRGPRSLPGPLTPSGVPAARSRAADFERVVDRVAAQLRRHVGRELDSVRISVEQVPMVPADWVDDVPLSAQQAGRGRRPARIVVYRMPVASRIRGPIEAAGLVLDLLIEEAADLLGRDPDELDPRLR